MCLNREVGLAEVGKIIRFIRDKSIVVLHCSVGFVGRLLQSAVVGIYTQQRICEFDADWVVSSCKDHGIYEYIIWYVYKSLLLLCID